MGNPGLGAAAVVGAIAAFGSFGVPIKSRRLQEAQVHIENLCACSRQCSGDPESDLVLILIPMHVAGAPADGAVLQERRLLRDLLAGGAGGAAALHLVGHRRSRHLGAAPLL